MEAVPREGPEAAERPVLAITLGADGRIYCHDIAPDLLPVLEAICPGDPALAERRAVAAGARPAGSRTPEARRP